MYTLDWKVLPADVAHLRELAKRVREIAESDRNRECLRQWYLHGDNRAERPLLLTETDGGLQMVMTDFVPRCQEPWAKGQEWALVSAICHHEMIADDSPVEAWIGCPWRISTGDYGVASHRTRPETDGFLGAFHIDPPLTDLARDFEKLHPRTFSVDREASLATKAQLEEVFDGILGVRMRGNPWWTMGLTMTAIDLIGLEELMLYMYDQPEALHRLMAFLRDDRLALLDWLERENLLVPNNAYDYIGSGSRGYARHLPRAGWTPDVPLRTQDLWTLIESQETVGVGPDLYAEFIFPYENAFAQRFGSVYYGCCEPVHTRWEVLKQMANLRRVSISPWCDEEFLAEALGSNIGYSRKPNPTLVSTERFDEDAIRADLRHTLQVTRAHQCSVEIVMKDVHTLGGEPDRLTRWVCIAREEIARWW